VLLPELLLLELLMLELLLKLPKLPPLHVLVLKLLVMKKYLANVACRTLYMATTAGRTSAVGAQSSNMVDCFSCSLASSL
jgi:hypothetical protein